MAPQSDEAELLAAWAALAGQSGAAGWSTITIASQHGRFRAAVGHPGNAEALFVGFGQIERPPAAQLPKGRGFVVAALEPGNDPARPYWFVLSREPAGSRELFERMALDVMRTVVSAQHAGERALFQIFLSRIRAWQNFMQRPEDGLLGLEEQIGLVGELVVLEHLLAALADPVATLESWQGPLDGVQDFVLGHGAVEVKATTSAYGFPARISSLEQLDQTVRSPVIVAAVRLSMQAVGLTLPGWIDRLRTILGSGAARPLFENRMLQAGYFDGNRSGYQAAFDHITTRLLELGPEFPGLFRSAVPAAILRATYEIDLDLTPALTVTWDEALHRVGVN